MSCSIVSIKDKEFFHKFKVLIGGLAAASLFFMSVGVSVNVREVAYIAKKTPSEGGGTQGGDNNGGGKK